MYANGNCFKIETETKKGSLANFLLEPIKKPENCPRYLSMIYSDAENKLLVTTDGRRMHYVMTEAIAGPVEIPTGCYFPDVTKNAIFLTPDDCHFPAYRKVFRLTGGVEFDDLDMENLSVFYAHLLIRMIIFYGTQKFTQMPIGFESKYLQPIFDLPKETEWKVTVDPECHNSSLNIESGNAGLIVMPIKLKKLEGEGVSMLVCPNCCKEMRCIKNGVGVRFYDDSYPGDLFRCPYCGNTVIKTNPSEVYDPEHKVLALSMEGHTRGTFGRLGATIPKDSFIRRVQLMDNAYGKLFDPELGEKYHAHLLDAYPSAVFDES